MAKEKPETKICKHCKTQIPYGAKVCPQCRKKQGGKLKWIIIAIVAIWFLGAIAGENDSEKKEQETKGYVENDTKKEDKEQGEKETYAEEDNELTVGSTFEKKGLKITVNDADLDFSDYSDEYGFYTPSDGMKYIMVSFTFENTGNSDAYVSIYDFDCYADNTTCEQAYLPDGSDFINTNLSSGRNVSFKTYYSVPVDAKTIELEYETSIWTGEKAIIKLQ